MALILVWHWSIVADGKASKRNVYIGIVVDFKDMSCPLSADSKHWLIILVTVLVSDEF